MERGTAVLFKQPPARPRHRRQPRVVIVDHGGVVLNATCGHPWRGLVPLCVRSRSPAASLPIRRGRPDRGGRGALDETARLRLRVPAVPTHDSSPILPRRRGGRDSFMPGPFEVFLQAVSHSVRATKSRSAP